VNEMATLTGTEIVPDSCDVYDVHKLVGSPREGLLCVKTAIFWAFVLSDREKWRRGVSATAECFVVAYLL